MYENIVLSVNETLCSEFSEDTASLKAKYLICNFEPNANNVMLNRKTIMNWLSTLVDQPVVGKLGLTDGAQGDFTSHNMSPVVREDVNGKPYQDYEFNTEACGVFTDVGLETIKGKECITATAKLWKRFPNFIAVIKKRIEDNIPIATSWEIATKKFHYEMINGRKIKVIDDGQFLGHCMLSKVVSPAYKDSQLLEVAAKDNNNDLLDALSKDLSSEQSSNINTCKKEDESLTEEEKTKCNSEEIVEEVKVENEITDTSESEEETKNTETEISALTEYDLRKAIRKAIAQKITKSEWDFYIIYHFPANGEVWTQMWDAASELDIVTFTYTVENDVVTVSEPTNAKLSVSVSQINSTIAELNQKIDDQTNSLLEANEKIQTLSTTISELQPFKDSFEKAEQERIEAETSEKRENLKAYAIKSGFITDDEIIKSEEIKSFIEQVNEKEIRAIIAERFMKSLDEKSVEISTDKQIENKNSKDVETSQVKLNISESNSSDVMNHKSIMKKYLNK